MTIHRISDPTTTPRPEGQCPQCKAPVIQPRDSEPYCENCGWPDENRPEDRDAQIDQVASDVLEVVSPEGHDSEEWTQVRAAVEKSFPHPATATPQAAAAGEAPDWPEAAAREIRATVYWPRDVNEADMPKIAAIIRKHSPAFAKEEGRDTAKTPLCLTHPAIHVDYYKWLGEVRKKDFEAKFINDHAPDFQHFHAIAMWVWTESRQAAAESMSAMSPTQPDKKSV